jgi:hypothetical protein
VEVLADEMTSSNHMLTLQSKACAFWSTPWNNPQRPFPRMIWTVDESVLQRSRGQDTAREPPI